MSESEIKPRHSKKWACWGCSALVLGPVIFIVLAVSYSLVFSSSDRHDIPLTVEQARKLGCPIPLPDSARNVQFAWYSHWIEYESYVRFEADPSVCRAHVKTVVEANVKRNKEASPSVELFPAFTPSIIGGSKEGIGPVSWFDTNKIVHGVERRPTINYDPFIWIDDDRGVFYCRITD